MKLAESKSIFDGKDAKVVFIEGGEEVIFVTFSPLGLNTSGFGEDFLRKRNISAIHFISKWDHWWQTEEIHSCVEKVASFLDAKSYPSIVTYGASMGAHGAALFAGGLGANKAILFSPQFSIDPAKPPFDDRWESEFRKIRFVNDDMGSALDPEIHYSLFYDPRTADRGHADLFSRHKNIEKIPVLFGGHTPALVVNQAQLLGDVIDKINIGSFRRNEFMRDLRRDRRKSWVFWCELAAAAEKRHPSLAKSAYETSIGISDAKAVPPLHSMSGFCLRQNDTRGAIKWGRVALKIASQNLDSEANRQTAADVANTLSGIYMADKRFLHARQYAEQAVAICPTKPLFLRRLSHIHSVLANFSDAVNWGEKALAADERDVLSYLHLSGIQEERGYPLTARSIIDLGLKKLPGNLKLLARAERLPEIPSYLCHVGNFFDVLFGRSRGFSIVDEIIRSSSDEETISIASSAMKDERLRQNVRENHLSFFGGGAIIKPAYQALGLPNISDDMSFTEAFSTYYAPLLGRRREGFKRLFEAVKIQGEPPLILETGTLRLAGNWQGDGQSTFLFDRFAQDHGGRVLSIDVNPDSIDSARRVCSGYTTLICNDSVMALETMSRTISRKASLVYLDSFDVDRNDYTPSAIHHMLELAAVMPMLASGSVVAIDDFSIEGVGGGKGQLVDRYMQSVDAVVIYDGYQKIWQMR